MSCNSKDVKKTADLVLQQSQILETLCKFGEPRLTGAYALNLMYAPDIDIDVITADPKTVSRAVLDNLLDQDFFQRYEYGDFARWHFPNRPKGYILALQIPVETVRWEVEVWFLYEASKQEQALMELVREQLTPETREIILNLKHQKHITGISKHDISSADIYYGVLRHHLYTLDEIAAHIQQIRNT
ncbi:MAG: hypothetical protein JXA33_19455 [Anaerolineae bacterium]|nr:hypothetical protein [Anaerolineae bacterium]